MMMIHGKQYHQYITVKPIIFEGLLTTIEHTYHEAVVVTNTVDG